MKKTILIFGASSFIGSNILEKFKDDFRVIGTYYKSPITISGVTCLPCDVLNKENVVRVARIFKPDIVIYAVGVSSIRECLSNPKKAETLNTQGVINCTAAAERCNAKFIFLSSVFVFPGDGEFYQEDEVPISENIYGKTMSSSEYYIQKSCLNYLILRCVPLYGRSFSPMTLNWFEKVQLSFLKNETFYMDDKVRTGFLGIEIMVGLLRDLILKDATNLLFHVSSKDTLTKYEFSKLYAKIYNYNTDLLKKLEKTKLSETNTDNKMTHKQCFGMSCNKVEQFLETELPTIEESLRFLYKRLSR